MRNLSLIILLVLFSISMVSQSPHGDELKIKCEDCHNPSGWNMVKGTYAFNHDSTKFQLEGQHQSIDCKMCHTSLVFSKAEPDCMSCHTDMHYQTVGFECARCHTPKSPSLLSQSSPSPPLPAEAWKKRQRLRTTSWWLLSTARR